VRILFALLILFDLGHRSLDLVAHYTDFGLLPRTAIIEHAYSRWHWSLHFISGTWQMQALLFVAAGICAIFLLIGYQTRLATVASWAFMVSLSSRNPLVVVGDTLFRSLLFWAIFLPWGARFSVDWLRSGGDDPKGKPESYFGPATIAYIMQMIFVFWFGVMHKSGIEWRSEGTALYYALSFEQFTTRFGLFLRQFPFLLKAMTHIAFWVEAIGPLLILSPASNGPLRTIGTGMLVMLLLGILICLDNIGLFIWVTAAALLALLPGWFWEKVRMWVTAGDWRNAAVYYDGACGFCRSLIKVIRGLFPHGRVTFTPAQDLVEMEADMSRKKSWVVVDDSGVRHFGFEAVIVLADCHLFFRWVVPLLTGVRVKRVGNAIYCSVANHRRTVCSVAPVHSSASWRFPRLDIVRDAIIIGLLGYVFLWNVETLPGSPVRFSERTRALGQILGLDQEWKMFAPFPAKDNGWYVIPGKLRNGRIVDLFRDGEPVTWAKPRLVSATFKSFRWQKYMHNIRSQPYAQYRKYYADYLCRNWNRRHAAGSKLEELELVYVLEFILPDYEYSTPTKHVVFKHRCDPPV
jgi:predicted DCC family thiol-disulfide oxidoreductase YuxK